MRTLLFFAIILTLSVPLASCDKNCDDDPDCVYVNGDYIEIDVEDGDCDCA